MVNEITEATLCKLLVTTKLNEWELLLQDGGETGVRERLTDTICLVPGIELLLGVHRQHHGQLIGHIITVGIGLVLHPFATCE